MAERKGPHGGLKEFHEAELNKFYRMSAVNRDVAAFAALHYCNRHGLSVPDWLKPMMLAIFAQNIGPKPKRPVGRAGTPITRFRQDIIHYARWDTVCEVRDQQKNIRQQVEELQGVSGGEHILADREKMLHWVGHDFLRAYECASILLEETDAHGGPDAVKHSYCTVQRCSKDARQAMRFCLIDRSVLVALGLGELANMSFSMNLTPFYDRTP